MLIDFFFQKCTILTILLGMVSDNLMYNFIMFALDIMICDTKIIDGCYNYNYQYYKL